MANLFDKSLVERMEAEREERTQMKQYKSKWYSLGSDGILNITLFKNDAGQGKLEFSQHGYTEATAESGTCPLQIADYLFSIFTEVFDQIFEDPEDEGF